MPPASDDSGYCPTYHTGEGCALSGSPMAKFVQKFWPPAQVEQVLGPGNTIADQRVDLLWNDAAMVKLRAEIRANL